MAPPGDSPGTVTARDFSRAVVEERLAQFVAAVSVGSAL